MSQGGGLSPPKTNWALRVDAAPFFRIVARLGITFTYMGVEVRGDARYEGSTARLPWCSRPTCRPDYSANPTRSPPSQQGCWETHLASLTRSECRTETTAENAPPSSALTVALLSSTGVALVCVDCGDSWLAPRWVVAQPLCARARCDTGSGATASLSGPADRKVTAKPVRVGPARRLARVRIRRHWRSQYKLGTQPNSAVGCERICERNAAQWPR